MFRRRSGRDAVWVAEAAAINRLLREHQETIPVVANSQHYEFGAGDFLQSSLLADVAHAVMAPTDFRALWLRIAATERGLAGAAVVEWDVVRSPGFGWPYGYLLLKGSGCVSPVVIQPIVAREVDRVLSFARDVDLPWGVTLRASDRAVADWVGPLALHVTQAVAAFEAWRARGPSGRRATLIGT
jgi:hypothetical protein